MVEVQPLDFTSQKTQNIPQIIFLKNASKRKATHSTSFHAISFAFLMQEVQPLIGKTSKSGCCNGQRINGLSQKRTKINEGQIVHKIGYLALGSGRAAARRDGLLVAVDVHRKSWVGFFLNTILFLHYLQLPTLIQRLLGALLGYLLLKVGADLLKPSNDHLGSGPLDMQHLSSFGKRESLIQDHVNKPYSLLNSPKVTSVDILEYRFLCLLFSMFSFMGI